MTTKDLLNTIKGHRETIVVSALLSGESIVVITRRLSLLLEFLREAAKDNDGWWDEEELVIIAERIAPFLPQEQLLDQLKSLGIFRRNEDGQYRLSEEYELPLMSNSKDEKQTMLGMSMGRMSDLLLRRKPRDKGLYWNEGSMRQTLQQISKWGVHCISSWMSLGQSGKGVGGVPFLWNVGDNGETTPMGILPASSATIDVIRLAVAPKVFLGQIFTRAEKEIIRWSFDEILKGITFGDGGTASYFLPRDDSFPGTAHPVNDVQARILLLLLEMLKPGSELLDARRMELAERLIIAMSQYILAQQLEDESDISTGFWSLHRYRVEELDRFQVFSISTEFAATALQLLVSGGHCGLNAGVTQAFSSLVSGLERSARRDGSVVYWSRYFSTRGEKEMDLFASARSLLMIALARNVEWFTETNFLSEKAIELEERAWRLIDERWEPNFEEDFGLVERLPYRSPEVRRWSDTTFRMTSPAEAIMPTFVMRATRLSKIAMPRGFYRRIVRCLDETMRKYEGYGFWRDSETPQAYPSNTVFYMDAIAEYLRMCESELAQR